MNRARIALAATAVPLAAHVIPSVVSLGQWAPARALPGGWCRWRGPSTERVALTFDDGPDPDDTPRMLDRLDELGLRATFFCLGSLALRHPEVVAETVRRGHQIGVHGHLHRHHFAATPAWVRDDLRAATDALGAIGIDPRWYRPPYGQSTGATVWEAHRQRRRLVLWSVWGREWAEADAGAVADRVNRGLTGGAIVLLHDTDHCSPAGSTARARDALGPIAEALAARGLRSATLDDLVGAAVPGHDGVV